MKSENKIEAWRLFSNTSSEAKSKVYIRLEKEYTKKNFLIKNSSKNKQTKLPPCLTDGHNNYRGFKKTIFNNRKLAHLRKTRKPTKHSRLAIN